MIKISFLGDIMCEGPFMRAAQQKDGSYDFDEAFAGIQELLSESDFVIGNLETPFAGEDVGYTKSADLYSFNTPDCFAEAVKKMGVDLVLTANNHCFDRGRSGLIRTLEVLDRNGLKHTGTYISDKDSGPFYFTVDGVSLAVISCTSSTNADVTKLAPGLENVNLLNKQSVAIECYSRVNAIKQFAVRNIIGRRNYMKIRKILGKPAKKPSVDNYLDEQQVSYYVNRIKEQIIEAKKHANIVFVCPHMGGQFNRKPGKLSKYVIDQLATTGVDAIVCSHPHIVQKTAVVHGIPCFFSIGNISMSMGTEYIIREDLPDYGIIVHFYIDENRIQKTSYSIVKICEDKSGYIRVFLASDLYTRMTDENRKKLLADVKHIKFLMTLNNTDSHSVAREEILYY